MPRIAGTMAATDRPAVAKGLLPDLGTPGGSGDGTGGNRKFWRRNMGPWSPIMGNASLAAPSPPPTPGPAGPAASANAPAPGGAGSSSVKGMPGGAMAPGAAPAPGV